MLKQKIRLSLIIVTWNCADLIEKFITELHLSLVSYEDFEILIYDNSSSDETVSILRNANQFLFASDKNTGFAFANNRLIETAKYDSILLLNPDVFGFNAQFWSNLLKSWDGINPQFIRLLNQDGSFQNCVGDVLSLPRLLRKFVGGVDFSTLTERCPVGMGIMAFMLTSKTCLNQVGLLDEGYHMYSEDMDWCHRAAKKGYKIIYDPTLSLMHIGGASAVKRWDPLPTKLAKINSERIFVSRHYTGLNRLFLKIFLRLKKYYYVLLAKKISHAY